MSVELAYHYLYLFAITVLSVLLAAMLIRAVTGPRMTDRILSINMIGTMVISILAISSMLNEEPFLVDVALIYAMISFLSVLTLAMVYIPDGVKRRRFFNRDTEIGLGHPAGDDAAVRLGKWIRKGAAALKAGEASLGKKNRKKAAKSVAKRSPFRQIKVPEPETAADKEAGKEAETDAETDVRGKDSVETSVLIPKKSEGSEKPLPERQERTFEAAQKQERAFSEKNKENPEKKKKKKKKKRKGAH